jgi:hypothetical protein
MKTPLRRPDSHSTFDRFRGDPRFEDIAKKVGAAAPSRPQP